jgi:anti-sigma factor ChrR (cupin superfamily)
MGEASITAGRMMITTTDEDIVKPHHLKDLDIGEAYYQYGNRAFRVQLPYQGDPHGALIMPQLKEEELIKEMAEKEQTVESIIFSEQAA